MSFVGEKIEPNAGMPGKTVAELQVEKATLFNDCERLRGEVNILSTQKTELEKKIEAEQNLYDDMVLKTTAEMQQEAEKKLEEIQANLQKLGTQYNDLLEQLKPKVTELASATEKLIGLNLEIENTREKFNQQIAEADKDLAVVLDKVAAANVELAGVMSDTDKAKKVLDETIKQTELEKNKQQDFVDFLERKERDLKIWEQRLLPAFKEKYPEAEEMQFV